MQQIKIVILSVFFVLAINVQAQNITTKLTAAFTKFESDSQLQFALSSLYVIDAQTGEVVFEKNGTTGVAPASTQKIITSVAAFEVLGKNYRYTTGFYINKNAPDELWVTASGDPTLGSWRYAATLPDVIIKKLSNALKRPPASVYFVDRSPTRQYIPEGWIWQDMGNYYGAAPQSFNWKENQYDLFFNSKNAKAGEVVEVSGAGKSYLNEVTAGPAGSGDNAYAFLPLNGSEMQLTGTIPVNEPKFKISVSNIIPQQTFYNDVLKKPVQPANGNNIINVNVLPDAGEMEKIYEHQSPALDSIIYWFMKKSVNLYGEALIKTIAVENETIPSTSKAAGFLTRFWEKNGIAKNELQLWDGSGLSPLNRVTTRAQVKILQFARNKSWFPAFYTSFPEYNGMRMKSGTISGVKGFAGYHQSAGGKEYIFSFIVNNYNGPASQLVRKMYAVLDVLK